MVIFQDSYSGVVLSAIVYIRRAIFILGESLGEVEPKAVDLVLLQQKLQVAFHKFPHGGDSWLKSLKKLEGWGADTLKYGLLAAGRLLAESHHILRRDCFLCMIIHTSRMTAMPRLWHSSINCLYIWSVP